MKRLTRNATVGVTMIVWGLAGTACFPSMEWEGVEISRVKSPSGAVEAVVVEGSAGATTSTVTLVYIVQSGMAVPEKPGKTEILRADHVSNLGVAWKTNGVLDINFDGRSSR